MDGKSESPVRGNSATGRYEDVALAGGPLFAPQSKDSAPIEQGAKAQFADLDRRCVDRTRTPPPALNLDHFGSWGDWIRLMAELKNAPVDYVAWALLTGAASLIGATRTVQPWPGWDEPAVLWVALIGDPSTNKSPALDPIRAALHRIERARAAEQKKAAPAHKADEEPDEFPMDPRLVAHDATKEVLAKIVSANPKGILLLFDELGAWLGNLDKYGAGDRPFYLAAFGARPYSADRIKFKGATLSIMRLALSILGTIQPDRLATLLFQGDDDGLLARILMIWPNPVPPARPRGSISETLKAEKRLSNAFERLARLDYSSMDDEPTPLSIPLSSAAVEIFAQWRTDHYKASQATFGLIASGYGKLPGIALRLSLVLAFLDWADQKDAPEPSEIDASKLSSALSLVDDYLKPMMHRALGEASQPARARQAAILGHAIVAKGYPAKVNAREISREWRLPGLTKPADIEGAIEVLVEHGWLALVKEANGSGRPRKDYTVNPELRSSRRASA